MNHSGWPVSPPLRLRDVELKRVHDLVAEHAIGLRHRRRERHGDAAARCVGDAADRIRQQARHDVGLRELGLAAVEHQRLPRVELVIEQRREARVPALGELRRDARRALFARVVIDVEVFGGENAEIEVDVLDLVAAEILRAERRRARAAPSTADTTNVRITPVPLRALTLMSGRARCCEGTRGVSNLRLRRNQERSCGK